MNEDTKNPEEQKESAAGQPTPETTPPDGKVSEDRQNTPEGQASIKKVEILETDLEEYKRLAELDKDHKAEREKWEAKIEELESQIDEIKSTSEKSTLEIDPEAATPVEDQQNIVRDLKRQERDFLATNKEYQEMLPKEKKAFNEEFNLRKSQVLKKALKDNEFIARVDLEDAFAKSLRMIRGGTTADVEKARKQGATDAANIDAGNVPTTSSVHKESKVISDEAYAIAKNSLLVADGTITLEAMAAKIQKRIDEGR